ncbi:MAG: hypothetical protein Q3M24_03185 [Candidatus Electrothrix aestuarii]|uniref:CDP-Glycerol:Poly(Glycerophosphate) glycerophosphotransferase n=1 Tax=Candidatus Electrothrix aestuarii TaxID=3062594 RepID=A0AAU8LW55_9BACT|nr:hypothetical protein [Candidatus Electrothrix aestuarii]
MGRIRREDITKHIEKYERTHNVTSYTVSGKAIWPIIRITLSLTLHAGTLQPVQKKIEKAHQVEMKRVFWENLFAHAWHIYASVRKKIKRLWNRFKNYLSHLVIPLLFQVPRCDVLIITNKNRQITWGDEQYNIIAGPLREVLEARNVTSFICERDEKTPWRYYIPIWQAEMNRLRSGGVSQNFVDTIQCPVWFDEVYKWVIGNFDVELTWSFVEQQIRSILYFKHIIKPWIRKTKCKLVVTDCWYNVDCLSFVLAASELGLDVLDFQHGLQGEGHFAYQAWIKAPDGGYDLIPNKFWVWGDDDAKKMLRGGGQHLTRSDIFVGGNLWLNKWKEKNDTVIQEYYRKAVAISAQSNKVLLVTLQKGVDNLRLIKDTLKESPKDWLWMIRVHRNDHEKLCEFERYFAETKHPGINLRDAIELPLYTLFQISDVHITGFSTCALEALAFHVPSIIIHESGKRAFRKYLERGVMQFARNKDELVNLATSSFSEEIFEDSQQNESGAFAHPGKAEEAIGDLIRMLI